ncbi:Asp-tRNA(Asn)/Glu-tRNA(Gln) amidotransferase subunit GatB [bacterium]|nr:Asp-tRNA(Asn)/Glu-tRNA(Gln) amidotransferase subunit GatB [bacterium]
MSQDYEIVIGLEVHVELSTASKIFCGCPTTFGAEPNTQVCPVCLGLPGTLPVLNQQVLTFAIRAALACNCQIAQHTKFDRKNYFYPDLPKAYQISQYDMPLAEHGSISIDTTQGEKSIGITRVHLEEDAGKLVHQSQGGQIGTAASSLADYNRTGVPLIEIVSEPDLRSADEAYAYLTALKEILLYTKVSDCNMEEGSLRCDANISVRPRGQEALGTKAELKNMNSFKNIRDAIEYEAKRQIRVLEEGGKVEQETRLWDADKGTSHSMRSKEEAHDYRYFPEPDLPVVYLSEKMIADQQQQLPEMPQARRHRFQKEYGLSEYDAGVCTMSPAMAEYFEDAAKKAVSAKVSAKTVCNWITVELQGKLKADGKEISNSPIASGQMAELTRLIERGKISGKMGKDVFADMYVTGKDPEVIVQEKGLSQISNSDEILKMVAAIIAANPNPVAEYKSGKTQTIGFLVGQVMKASQGQANPKLVNQILRDCLDKNI